MLHKHLKSVGETQTVFLAIGVKTAVDIFRTKEMLHLFISWEEALGIWGALAGNSLSPLLPGSPGHGPINKN